MTIVGVVILAIVEGLTEFLPVSSTGYIIITSSLLGIASEHITKIFTINIQFGTILSLIVLFWRRFFRSFDFYKKLFIAIIPAAFFGLLLEDQTDKLLDNVVVVAISLVLGGIILVFIDNLFDSPKEGEVVSFRKALAVGLFQCTAMNPGVSRTAATFFGGMSERPTKKTAAAFSFFLAAPTLFAASSYKLLKDYKHVTPDNHLPSLVCGNIVGYLVALQAIKSLIAIVTKYGFKAFGYYRIALGVPILLLIYFGTDLHII